jgi:hypothetical protein
MSDDGTLNLVDVETLARAIAATKGDRQSIESLYELGTSWLDVPDEWFMTPRELATAILADLPSESDAGHGDCGKDCACYYRGHEVQPLGSR